MRRKLSMKELDRLLDPKAPKGERIIDVWDFDDHDGDSAAPFTEWDDPADLDNWDFSADEYVRRREAQRERRERERERRRRKRSKK